MKRIIRVEGYKAFHGIMKINYANPDWRKPTAWTVRSWATGSTSRIPIAGTAAAALSRLTAATSWR